MTNEMQTRTIPNRLIADWWINSIPDIAFNIEGQAEIRTNTDLHESSEITLSEAEWELYDRIMEAVLPDTTTGDPTFDRSIAGDRR